MTKFWIAGGSRENWLTAFEQGNIWGLRPARRAEWEQISEDDIIFFYVTGKGGGIVGYGAVRTRFRQDKPLWPEEVAQGRTIWPLRFEFDVEECLPPDKWESSPVRPRGLFPRRGFQELDSGVGRHLVALIRAGGRPKETTAVGSATMEEGTSLATIYDRTMAPALSHDAVKSQIAEIGKLQKFLVEQEYDMDGQKIDVVWRRVERSVPTYAFEVQIGGNLFEALAKLKHAFDLWNSHIFLVAREEDRGKVDRLLSGTFHEIRDELKFLELNHVALLHQKKRDNRDTEKALGIL